MSIRMPSDARLMRIVYTCISATLSGMPCTCQYDCGLYDWHYPAFPQTIKIVRNPVASTIKVVMEIQSVKRSVLQWELHRRALGSPFNYCPGTVHGNDWCIVKKEINGTVRCREVFVPVIQIKSMTECIDV